MTTFIVIAILIALLAPLLYTCVIITDQSNVRIVETFGRFSFIAESGLSFKLPAPIQVAKPNFSLKVMELRETISLTSSLALLSQRERPWAIGPLSNGDSC